MTAVAPSPTPQSAHAAAQAFSPKRRTLVLVVVALAFVMDLLDTTIMNVAVPSIQRGLHASISAIQWCLAGYTLVFATLLIFGGRLGDSRGYRTMFLTGVGGFTLASLGCGAAGSATLLVLARLCQGAFAALMVPQVMALMQVMYPPHERVKVYAVFGVLGGTSAALGPIIGGLLIHADWWGLGWRLCFLINLPVGLFSLIAGYRLLPGGRSTEAVGLDLGGAVGSTLCLGALLYALIQGPESGWSADTVVALVLSLPMAVLLWRRLVRRSASGLPVLLNPALFQLRGVRLGLACSLCVNGLTPAYLLMMTYVLQFGRGVTPLTMSLLSLPVALGATLGITVLGQRLLMRFGSRTVLMGLATTWLAITAVGAWVSFVESPIWLLLVCQALMGVGLGLTGPSLSAITLQEVPVAQAGSAAGLVTTGQQLSGALAVALTGWLFFRVAPPGSAPETAAYARSFHYAMWLIWGLLAAGAWLAWHLPALMRGGRTTAPAH